MWSSFCDLRCLPYQYKRNAKIKRNGERNKALELQTLDYVLLAFNGKKMG